MASQNESRSVSVFINGDQADQTLKQITSTAAKLRAELGRLVPGTQAFKDKVEELKSVNSRLQSVKDDVNGLSGAMGFLKSEIGKLGVLATGILGFQFLTEQIHNTIAGNAKLSDSMADVQKSTGMSEMAVRRLEDSFKTIDTRTAKKDLTELAFVAGKLGISGERDVLAFVRAADQIGVTLGKAFGNTEEAINDIGKIVQIFKIKDQYGLEQALLKTGSAINDLGNAGTANEGYIVEFTKRLGGIAPAAKISLQNVLGLATVFDELGQPVEASSTAVGKLMVMIGNDIPKYSKVAQMSIKDFSNLLNTDGNAALIAVLKNVKGTNGGIADLAAHMGMIGEDASRSITAIGALANNLDLLQNRQDLSNKSFEKGLSLTNQFSIKNNDFGAMLDKLGKKLNAIGSNLTFTDFLIKCTKLTGEFIDFIGRNIDTLGMLLKLVIAAAAGYAVYNTVLALSKIRQLEFLATLMESEAITRLLILVETALSVVTLTLSGRTKEAREAMLIFNAAMEANPIGLVLGAVGALVTAMILFNSELSESVKIQGMLNDINAEAEKSILKEKMALEDAMKTIADRTKSKTEEAAAVKTLRDLMPDHLKGYSDEAIMAGKATEAVNKHIESIQSQARAMAAQNKLMHMQEEIIDLQVKQKNGYDSLSGVDQAKLIIANQAFSHKGAVQAYRDQVQEEIDAKKGEMAQISEVYAGDINKTKTPAINSPAGTTETPKRTVQVIEAEIAALQTEQKQVSSNTAEWKKYEAQIKKLQDEEEAITHAKADKAGLSAEQKALKEKEKALADFKALAEQYKVFQAAELADIMSKNDKEIAVTEAKYDKMILAEQHFLSEKGTTKAQRDATSAIIADLQVQKDKEVKAVLLRQEQELTAKIVALRTELSGREESLYDQELNKINQFYDQQLRDAGNNAEQIADIEQERQTDLIQAKLNEEKRFQEEKRKIQENGWVLDGKTDALETARINKKYDDQLAALKLKFSKELQATKEYKDAVASINGQREQEQGLEKAKQTKALELQSAQDVANAVFTIAANNRKAETDAKISDLEKQKTAELANQNLTEGQKAAINKKYDDQEKEIKLEAWKADKQAAEEQAIINGALAVVKALPNPFAAIAAGVAAAAQVAVIAAQPVPQFYDGGYSGVDHTAPQGWVNRPTLFTNSSSGRPFSAGEKYKTEYIVSSEQLKDPVIADFVSTMEAHRGVRRFEAGGYSNATVKPGYSQSSAAAPRATTPAPAAAPQIDLSELIDETKKTRKAIEEKELVWSWQHFQKESAKLVKIQTDATG